MPKRSSIKRKDVNQLAASIVEQASGTKSRSEQAKNPAAVILGRLGGLKGGLARARQLTPKRKREIAKMAALARWGKKRVGGG
jgi:hypothetical protein